MKGKIVTIDGIFQSLQGRREDPRIFLSLVHRRVFIVLSKEVCCNAASALHFFEVIFCRLSPINQDFDMKLMKNSTPILNFCQNIKNLEHKIKLVKSKLFSWLIRVSQIIKSTIINSWIEIEALY